MKKSMISIFLVLFAALLLTSDFASANSESLVKSTGAVTCTTVFHSPKRPVISAELEINYGEKSIAIKAAKESFQGIFEVSDIDVSTPIEEFKKCKLEIGKCIFNLVKSLPETLTRTERILQYGLHTIGMQSRFEPELAALNYSFDPTSVRYGVAYITGSDPRGERGLFEYFDANKNLVGRLLINGIQVIECR